jgi:hypothetical protein
MNALFLPAEAAMSVSRVLSCATFVGCLLTSISANAQSQADDDRLERLQRRTELLEKELKALRQEIKKTKKDAEKVEKTEKSEPAQGPLQATVESSHAVTSYQIDAAPAKSLPSTAGVKVTLGGFVAAESVYRTHNQVADMGSNFNSIPYPFSPLYREHEFHGSARGTRLSLLAEGNIDPARSLAAYVEADFLGVGQNSNYIEVNSWTPRLRQGYLTYDDTDRGFHLLGGQAWSLLTQNKVGIVPRQENLSLTIDYNNMVGFDYTRNWQVRFVGDFHKTFWFGVSLEAPAVLTPPGNIPSSVNGLLVNFSNTGTGGFLNGVNVSTDQAPDIIAKAALDPGWGHYEVFGIQRFFTDSTFCSSSVPTGCVINTIDRKTSYGTGVGGSVLLPVVPKYLDLQASFMYGRGIGRYGSGQLPDVTIASDGALAPITALHSLVGLVVHPVEGLDIYSYAGMERAYARYFNLLGYGNPSFDNAGCLTPSSSSFSTGTTTACVANNRRLSEVTVGFWKDLYKGPAGRLALGAQYEYLKREAFEGVGGAPHTEDSVVYTSIRYYPF